MGLSNYSLGDEEFTENCSNFLRSLIAEFIGTFILLFFGVLSTTQETNLLVIAFAFGTAIAAAVTTLGHVSGCHVNPAVTIAFLVVGRCSLIRAIFYIVFQIVGAIVGTYCVNLVTGKTLKTGHTVLGLNISAGHAVIIELIFTMFLMFVVMGVIDKHKQELKPYAPLAIGLAVITCVTAGGHYTGASMNPARTLGTAVVMEIYTDHWVYWVGPIAGGILGSVIYVLVFEDPDEDSTALIS